MKQKHGIIGNLRPIGNCSQPPRHATRLQEQQKREEETCRKLNSPWRRREISSSEIASYVSKEQALVVIRAGRKSGMSEGQLRALAAAMEYQPHELNLQPPQTSAEDMLDALQACPEALGLHQMLKIVQAMGGDASHEDIIAWAQDNCHDTFEDDC